ncbi:MAG: DUF2085 domain-containing protein [Chlorobiales bacterium]|nr:DUF2085 domain-containing protein [Chlorobiales bacterium]
MSTKDNKSYGGAQAEKTGRRLLPARLLAAGIMFFILMLTVIAPLLGPVTGAGIYTGFSHICHQQADRCLFISGYPMAICARCTAIYAGIGAGSLFVRPINLSPNKSYIAILALALGLVGLDVLTEWIGIYENFLPTRLLTGLLFGISLSPFLLSVAQEFIGAKSNRPNRDSSTR